MFFFIPEDRVATQPPTLLNSRESGSWPVVYPLSPSWGERNAIVITTVVEEACKKLEGGAEVLRF